MSKRFFPLTFTFLALSTGATFGQGSLTPPSGPAPSMKTLGQIEPRVIIEKLPFRIAASGSYYVAANLTVPAAASGISIEADNVTLDLGGFAIHGESGSLQAILIAAGRSDVLIKNGSITAGQAGIEGTAAARVTIEKVRIVSTGGAGISLGTEATVKDCHATGNDGPGIRVHAASTVAGSQSSFNFGNGIEADQKSSIRDCSATSNVESASAISVQSRERARLTT
jgi:hypothetical protein